MKKEILAIYGGTFSPPHIGHIRAAEAASAALSADRFMILVDNLPPHKEIDGGANAEQRLRMASLAFSHIPKVEISDMEIRRGGRSYTAVTLSELSAPDREMYFLCGTDMFLSLPCWRDPEIIFEKAVICVVRREEDSEGANKILSAKAQYEKEYGARIRLIDAPVTEISSTDLRESLASAPWVAERWLSPEVYAYIRKEGLWPMDEEKTLASLREDIRRFMSEKRYRHTLGVEKMIRRMADLVGAPIDAFSLSAAALLHDISKEMSEEEQRKTVKALGLSLSESQSASPAILHSFTAEHRIAEFYPFLLKDERIARAIRAHTTGAPEMSLFDKLLFAADYIEEGREYKRCIEARESFLSSIEGGVPPLAALDALVLFILESTISFLRARGLPLCEDTLLARDALLAAISSND